MKKILAKLLLAVLLALMLAGCGREKTVLGQLDRFEVDGDDVEWAVISIDEPPYSVSFPENEEFNSETTRPGVWLTCALDGNYAYDVRLAVFA